MKSRVSPSKFTEYFATFPMVSCTELLSRTSETFPDKTAILFKDETYTFADLEKASNRVARGLQSLGLKKGDRVLLSLFTNPDYLIYFYGILKAGGIVVPMNPSYKSTDARGILQDAEPAVALMTGSSLENLRSILRSSPVQHVFAQGEKMPEGILQASAFFKQFPSTAPNPVPIDVEEDVAFLPYSSGTTGKPKGAMLTHRNLVACLCQYVAAGRVSESDVSLIFVPATHVYGTTLLTGGVTAGATLVLMERYSLEAMLQLIERHRVTLCYGTTSVLVEMANFPRLKEFDLSSIRYINSGGSPLPKEVSERVNSVAGIKVANGYGMTEVPISGSRVPGEDRKIADPETGAFLNKPCEMGEVVIRGPQVMKGYWRDPETTSRVLKNGWFYTGDIGYLDEKGNLVIVDRKKEIIKYKGFAIPPSELEGVLLEHPAVADCAVVGVAREGVGEVPKAFVVLKGDAPRDAEPLLEFVSSKVAGYKKIREVVFVDSLPRNAQGKIVKRLLK